MKIGGYEIDKKNIIIMVLCILLIITGWFLFGNNRTNVYNDRERIDIIRNDISGITDKQQSSIDCIESVENGLNSVAGRIGTIQDGIRKTESDITGIAEAIGQSTERIANDADRIKAGQSILKGVRARGQEKTE